MIYTDESASEVTVVPTGYMDDVTEDNLPAQVNFVAGYVKNGFDDYELISPAEILALMASADLITKTGTDAEADYWTNDNDLQDGSIYQASTGTIVFSSGQYSHLTIPVRRVTIV